MKKALILLVLLCLPVVSALSFPEDTTFKNGNIDFTISEGVNIDNFDMITSGIIIDDYRVVIVQEGGKLEVVFDEWSDDNKKLLVTSNVPQTLKFKITRNGEKYYVYDGEEYAVDSYDIGVEEVEWSFAKFEENRFIDEVIDVRRNNWWNTIVFFFEVPELSTGTTSIGGRIVFLTYKSTIITIIALVSIIVFIGWVRKK